MTKTINNTALRTALVLGITLGSAGAMTAISTPLTATDAQAFGWSDVTGAAKKVGGAAKKAGKYVGKAGASMGVHAGKTAVRAAQGVRDASLTAAGRVTYAPTAVLAPMYFRATGQWNEKNKQILKDMERDWNERFDNAGDKMDRGIRRVGGATGEFIRKGGVTSGESLPRPEPSPEAKRRMQNGLRDFANGGGLNRPMKSGLAKGGAFYNGRQGMTSKSAKAVRSVGNATIGLVGGKPVGNTMVDLGYNRSRKPAGRDRSGMGRPVGQVKKPFLSKGTKAPVRGITKENLRPSKGQTMKIALPKGQLGNDRSVWGRPVGGAKAPVKGITRKDIKRRQSNGRFQTGVVRDKSFHGTQRSKPIGNDKSVWGRPVGGKKPIGQDRSAKGRPVGIRKQDLQPRQKTKRKMQTRQKFTRDLSRKKRGNGRNGRKFENKRQNLRTQMKRSNNKRNFNKGGRRNRRG